ncbi:MAG: DUF86 domain-containing protein [Candidatus Aenigmarchaeota archaeon]|nr:DUF86 domain-containing protein [Candidatus Aenigmarchaeota archaeon]
MKAEIANKLADLKKYYDILSEYRKYSLIEIEKDFMLRGAIERYMQLCLEIIIEIGEMIIANECFEKPKKHREVIEILCRHNILPQTFANRFAPAVGLRNILVHKYGDVDIRKLHKNLHADIDDFDTFTKHVSKYLKNKSQR